MTALKDLEVTGVADADSRQAPRFPLNCRVRVSCLVTERSGAAQGLNISAHGMAFLAPDLLADGTLVQVALPNSGFISLARVRNCSWHEAGWRIGVELLGSLG
ncbi:MAG: PilZ domain-containing protein [Ignavibacteriota bacterium]